MFKEEEQGGGGGGGGGRGGNEIFTLKRSHEWRREAGNRCFLATLVFILFPVSGGGLHE